MLGWVGEGRALTQTGRVRLADVRELVVLLDTGDLPDPQNASARITSSAELPELTAVVEWAKACRLVRVNKGRLVPVKKNMALLDRPLELWAAMLEALPAAWRGIVSARMGGVADALSLPGGDWRPVRGACTDGTGASTSRGPASWPGRR